MNPETDNNVIDIKNTIQKTYHCFDWDDNLIFMPTHIVLFHKENYEEIILSTESFAHHRCDIGQDKEFFLKDNKIANEGEKRNFKDYIMIGDGEHPSHNSFREFRDCEEKFFINHLKEAIKSKSFGPEWELFLKATETDASAKNVYIITARGHSSNTIYEGIKYLKTIGLINFHIPRKNIYPVSHKKFKGVASSPQAVKLKILKSVFTTANNQAKKDQTHHTVYFSDDDLKTMNHLTERLTTLRGKRSYWQNVHIRLRYTGTKNENKELLAL